jgi:hypothetical protein
MLEVLTTASNGIELDLLLARLRDSGIHCMHSAGGARSGLSGGRDVLVEEADLDRAREVLNEEEGGFDEEELARLSEEAGREAGQDAPQQTGANEQGGSSTTGGSPDPAKKHGLGATIESLARGGHQQPATDEPLRR